MKLIDFIAGFRKRKEHIYCLGAAKTGTTSIAHMYNGPLRASHEPNVKETTQLVINYLNGELNDSECSSLLLKRDKQLNLELESSHPLGYFAPYLVKLFPDAKFIITIRDPYSWLRSRVNFHLHRNPNEWSEYRDFIWSKHHEGYMQEELCLKESGLYSLDAYLKQYSEQYKIILNSIPESMRLIIKTKEISFMKDEMTKFMGISDNNISIVHTNKMQLTESLYDELPESFIKEKVEKHCGWIINEFFSEK